MPSVLLQDGARVAVGNVYAVGRNYAAHARELGNEVPAEPFFFLKATGSLWCGEGALRLPFGRGPIHHEVEMVVLLGRGGHHFTRAGARAAIRAVGVGLDLTLRELQAKLKEKGLPWTLAKSFPDATVVSAMRVVPPELDLGDLPLELSIDGQRRQAGRTSSMITDVPGQLAYLSARVPLLPGDILFTGTPEGVGPLSPGQTLELSVGELARLTVAVEARDEE